jgi:short-subunit dehydrogenase
MKRVLITGGSDGIGLETARLLSKKGDHLTLVARKREKLEQAINALMGSGHDYIIADLTKKEEVHKVADHLNQHHYDVLINSAGSGMYGRFEELDLHSQVNMMHLNMWSLTVLSHSYLAKARKGDALVNLSSTLGVTSFPGLAVYSATKAYVTSLSDSLWWENKSRGVYVLGFCPGATATRFHHAAGGDSEIFPKYVMQNPVKVAQALVQALTDRRKPRAVSGNVNRLMLFLQRFLSRKSTVNMMGSFSPVRKSQIAHTGLGEPAH